MSAPAAFSTLENSLLHRDISAFIKSAGWSDWPDAADLSTHLASDIVTTQGQPLRFELCDAAGVDGAAAYEAQIDRTGIIPLRPQHWHDLFNALMWISFPAIKVALNAIHIRELEHADARGRSARRDAVTLLDECGVLLLVDGDEWTAAHRAHDWDHLFVSQRAAWGKRIVPLTLGHGLYEQCLTPYVGLTGKALHVRVPRSWFDLPDHERRRHVDRHLSYAILSDDRLLSTAELLPLPVLGVPDWWPDNEDAVFYTNRRYFRPARS